jgi:peptidylprolyl isomerase
MATMRGVLLTIGVCAALAIAGCGGSSSSSSTGSSGESTTTAKSTQESTKTKPKVEVPSGPPPKKLESTELIEGTGAVAKAGDQVTVQYVLVDYNTGEEIEASWDRGEPFTFTLGAGEVIPGWDKGVAGMKVGGRRELIIPPSLAYGSQASGPIAANSTLIFVIDLLAVK